MDAKRYAEACPKFVASQKLSPALGTLLNLADCYEKNGQVASAWARFHEAIALAQRLGRADREKTARDRADKLEPRLLKVTINARSPSVEVKIDGTPLDAAALGTPIPVDPGKHSVEATAKGKKPFATSIDVSDRSRALVVDIPALEDDAGTTTGSSPPTPPPPKEGEKEERGSGDTMRIVGIVAIGVGVVGAGVGTYFGLRTSSLWSDAQSRCSANNECDARGVELAGDAKSSGNISTIAFIAGGALALGGVVLFFTAPSAPVRANVGLGSVSIEGRF